MAKIIRKIKLHKPKMYHKITGLKGGEPTVFDYQHNKKKSEKIYWITWWRKRNTARKILVNMELKNGMHRIFLVLETEGGFNYRSGRYLFDDESKYYNIENGIWCYDYHESLSLPIKRTLPIIEITKAIESDHDMEMEYAINPLTIKRFAVAKIAEGIMKGQQLDEALRMLIILAVISVVSNVCLLVLFMMKTGMLKSLQGSVGL